MLNYLDDELYNPVYESLIEFDEDAGLSDSDIEAILNGDDDIDDIDEYSSDSWDYYDDDYYDFDDAVESMLYGSYDYDDDYAYEGLYRSKASKQAVGGMSVKELLEIFVESKGEEYFVNDRNAIKEAMQEEGVDGYKLVTVSGIVFGVPEDGSGAYYMTKGRKVAKLKESSLKRLQKSGARSLTKSSRKQWRSDKVSGVKNKFRRNKDDDAEEGASCDSWFYDEYDDYY